MKRVCTVSPAPYNKRAAYLYIVTFYGVWLEENWKGVQRKIRMPKSLLIFAVLYIWGIERGGKML